METTIRSIPLNKLKASPANVRRQRQEKAIQELAASIEVHGLLQMPVVRPELNGNNRATGFYLVDVGESRRQALLLLAGRKSIKHSEPIDCAIRTDDGGAEISLAENVVRMSMHPADQFEAFARLQRDKGFAPEEIAARFGVTVAVVRKRLKLAAVSEGLMQRCRDDELTLEQLMAFTITDDHALQEQVWTELGGNSSPAAIRRRLTSSCVGSHDRRVRLIGLDAYEKAGGAVLRDLFSTDEYGWAVDSTLLDSLVMERLQASAVGVREEGWQWVEAMIDYPYARVQGMHRVHPAQVPLSDEDQARHDTIGSRHDELVASDGELSSEEEDELCTLEAEIEAFSAREKIFDAGDLARAGAFVSLDVDGGIRVDRGLLRPEDEIVAEPADCKSSASDENPDGEGASETSAEGERGNKPISEKLVTELSTARTLALQACLTSQPDVAPLAVTHALTVSLFYGARHDAASCLALRPLIDLPHAALDAVGGSRAALEMARQRETWASLLPKEAAGLWDWLLQQDAEMRLGLLAFCVASTVDAVCRPHAREAPRLTHADRLADAVGLDMTAWWAPDLENYLGRVSKAHILEAVREAVSPQAAENLAGLKKGPMATRAGELLSGTGWLPEILRPVAAME